MTISPFPCLQRINDLILSISTLFVFVLSYYLCISSTQVIFIPDLLLHSPHEFWKTTFFSNACSAQCGSHFFRNIFPVLLANFSKRKWSLGLLQLLWHLVREQFPRAWKVLPSSSEVRCSWIPCVIWCRPRPYKFSMFCTQIWMLNYFILTSLWATKGFSNSKTDSPDLPSSAFFPSIISFRDPSIPYFNLGCHPSYLICNETPRESQSTCSTHVPPRVGKEPLRKTSQGRNILREYFHRSTFSNYN